MTALLFIERLNPSLLNHSTRLHTLSDRPSSAPLITGLKYPGPILDLITKPHPSDSLHYQSCTI